MSDSHRLVGDGQQMKRQLMLRLLWTGKRKQLLKTGWTRVLPKIMARAIVTPEMATIFKLAPAKHMVARSWKLRLNSLACICTELTAWEATTTMRHPVEKMTTTCAQ